MRYDDAVGVEKTFTAGSDDVGTRLDHFLARALPEASRTFLQRLVADDLAEVNGRAAKPAHRLKAGDVVDVFLPEPVAFSAAPEAIPLTILYEDADLAVVDKPPRLVVHPSPGHERGTLVNALAYHCQDLSGIGGVLRPGIVHRLDQDTSGCLVVAKNDRAHQSLMDQWQRRSVEKIYLALTAGTPRPTAGRAEGRIGRDPRDRRKMALVQRGGREALTEYRLREMFGAVALVECRLHTGRTHQIRVHMRAVGAPVLCDADYGNGRPFTRADAANAVAALTRLRDDADRLTRRLTEDATLDQREHDKLQRALVRARAALDAPTDADATLAPAQPSADDPAAVLLARQGLHAWKLAFDHPTTRARMAFEAPMPADMASVVAALRAYRDGAP